MSTKIYNGYRSTLGLYELLDRFRTLVPHFQGLKKSGYSKYLTEETVFKIDRCQKKGETINPRDILFKKHDTNVETVKETIVKGIREPDLDFTAKCSVLPMGMRKTLILFYCDNPLIREAWEALPFVQDYHYQNSSDRPKDVSAWEWRRRERDWNTVLKNEAPIKRGFAFTFNTEQLPTLWDVDLQSYFPDKTTRATRLLHDQFLDDCYQQWKAEHPDETEFKYSLFIEWREEWMKWKKTDAFPPALKEMEATLLDFVLQPTQPFLKL